MLDSITNKILDKWERMALTEMVFSRREVCQRIEDNSQQIVENWCLIRYSRLTGYAKETVDHWKTELSAAMSKITRLKLTKASSGVKKKLLEEVWKKLEYSFDDQSVWNAIYHKLRVEKIDAKQPTVHRVCEDFVIESSRLINLMATTDVVAVDDYVDSL